MVKMRGEYLGQKRMQLTHEPSQTQIVTDAPVDNHGLGQSFSPTDLLSVSLGTCMCTVMGIYADQNGINLTGMRFEAEKEMSANPRKVKRIGLQIWMPSDLSDMVLHKLKEIALTCPVKRSLHPDIEIDMSWKRL
jgi:uncharacterized OsmC-like protein